MGKKTACVFLALLLVSTLQLVVRIPQVKAWNETVYIHADGGIDPPTAPIQQNWDLYTLTGNIISDGDGIVIEKSSMTFDGNGHTVQGNYGGNGLSLTGIGDATIRNTNVQGFYYGVFLAPASQNTISGNNITANDIGIVLISSSDYNNIAGNNIEQNNAYGIYVDSSSNNNIYHNNFADNLQQVFTSYSMNIWDYGYPSGGNHWSDYSGTDSLRGPNQNETGSDGIGDDSYIIDPQNKDSYPLMSQYPCIYAIAVQDVKTFPIGKTVVGQGFTARVSVSVVNQGHFVETFNITAYASITVIKKLENVTLNSENFATVTLVWNTSGFTRGNYTVSAMASAVSGEAYTSDNTFADGVILVSFVGDVNGDGKVRVDDVLAVATAFGGNHGGPKYNPNLDVNDDLKIRVDDVLAVATHFGQGP